MLKSALLCVRESKNAWYKKDEVKISQDFGLSVVEVEDGPTRTDEE